MSEQELVGENAVEQNLQNDFMQQSAEFGERPNDPEQIHKGGEGDTDLGKVAHAENNLLSEKQRVVDPETGIYTDENGEKWGSKMLYNLAG